MTWTAKAFVFSGRPDPAWELSAGQQERLGAVWAQLLPADDLAGPTPPGLGYRGVEVRSDDGRVWTAMSGRVVLTSAEGTTVRQDGSRSFEGAVLATAPAGLLPPGLV